jgi:hypothetical protein
MTDPRAFETGYLAHARPVVKGSTRGEHDLKGVPEPWRLFALAG